VNPLKVCPQCGTEYPANARFCEIDGTALRSASGSTDLVGSIVADRYHVMKKLGEGGMGQVYLAEHVKMGRKSALKVMHPGMKSDVDAISRFNREAANASRIAHPNVAAVYDFGETPDGIIYLAMEFVDGPPLTKVIEQQGALQPKRAAEIVRQTAEALAVAHDMGIVHRDLKPDNIMIARTRDGGDLVKVVDFGIAKAAGNEAQKVTKTGLVVGTPDYMSPEQLAGDKLDGRSDIYSLALVAFNMLTGTLPFPSDSQQESMIMRLTDRPKMLSEMRPDVAWPADVQAVMDKALERDVMQRYQNATDFGRALYQAVDRMPETRASEMGTQMMSTPATRQSAPVVPLPPGGKPTVPGTVAAPAPTSAMPAPVAAPQNVDAVTRTAAPPPKRGIVPIVGGIAAVLVLGAGAWAVKSRGATADTAKARTDSVTQFGHTQDTTRGGGSAAQQGNSGQPTVTPPTTTAGSTPSPTGAGNGTPAVGQNLSAEFDRLDKLADTSLTAGQALQIVNSMKLTTAEDSVRRAIVRYNANLSKAVVADSATSQSLQKKACDALRNVQKLSERTTKKDYVASRLAEVCSYI